MSVRWGLILLLFASSAVAQGQPARARYEVTAIRYATIPGFAVSDLVKGVDPARKIDIAMYVWLARGGGRNVLVDSGFYRPEFFKSWKVADFVRPDEAVARAGVRPDEVTDIIVTHMHWDHAGSVDLFPKAQVWIQRDEYAYYTGAAWQEGGKHGGVTLPDLATILRVNTEGRLHLVDGDREILPGISVYTGGRHTWASQYAVVDAVPGKVVLASDNLYLYENLDQHLPIAQTFDADSNLRAQERMRTLATEPRLIIPGHDPAVLERFPKVREGIVWI
jgi:glyoxylase-like metal-dependent hydrolase (beta-lactamase superfamily II)